jgi:hypothetical protein
MPSRSLPAEWIVEAALDVALPKAFLVRRHDVSAYLLTGAAVALLSSLAWVARFRKVRQLPPHVSFDNGSGRDERPAVIAFRGPVVASEPFGVGAATCEAVAMSIRIAGSGMRRGARGASWKGVATTEARI